MIYIVNVDVWSTNSYLWVPLMSISNTINHDRWRHFVCCRPCQSLTFTLKSDHGRSSLWARSLMRPWSIDRSIDSEMITIDGERSSPSVVGPWGGGWYGSSVRSIMITSAIFNAIIVGAGMAPLGWNLTTDFSHGVWCVHHGLRGWSWSSMIWKSHLFLHASLMMFRRRGYRSSVRPIMISSTILNAIFVSYHLRT